MRRYNNLYREIYDIENIMLAHQRARRGKRHYREVIMVDMNTDYYITEIYKMLKKKSFRNSQYKVFERCENKKMRIIYKLPYYPDRIIHHCIMNILEPIWMKIFIRDTYASMKTRGIHDGMRRINRFLKNKAETRYCLKFDIRKFYPSIDHDILKTIIRQKVKCPDTLWLLDEIIDSAPGVPIGNYLSQYFANLYLAYFDHWMKECKHIRYYARYCDDVVIFHSQKQFLHKCFTEINNYLSQKLNLRIKSDWQIFPTRIRGVDFLGYRFFGTHTLIRKRIASTFKKKVLEIKKRGYTKKTDVNSLMSYYGWFSHGNGRNLWQKHALQLPGIAIK